ncbi:hypothetical protein OIU84_000988 [Salix udensis]|uniref:Bifunctional lysine-specific demethylase and histidyl-hydroxylase n=1 Tax=Salix udensis TaxID=889485 RepID=A0AAD6L601_9ROSI|nr:hypothetical protein OIU84_000988 [Salix udensis]
MDEGIVKGLILMLGSEKRKVSVAACNALLDLSSTLIGRRSLLEFSALEWFMFGFLQVPVSPILVSLCDEDERSVACARLAFKEDGHAVSILHAAITLINTCNVERLEKIPRKLSRKFLVSLKTLWDNVHNQMLLGNAWSSCRDRHLNLSNVTVNSLAENELNIISFLEEVRSELGCPLIYEQDIRVIRTEQPSKKEKHLKKGYTIALRGVEFRFASIATVADALASLFGQPSVGANIYLTPPNSQGLACHCDDHCVFVCQLFGTKQWSVYPQPNLQLPRLYDRFDRECCLGEQNSLAECRKFLLREGFPYMSLLVLRWNLHLSGRVLHMLHSIAGTRPQKQLHGASVEPLSGNLDLMSVTLLHLMIELIGASDSTLRKASLVGALVLPLEIDDWLYLNQKTTFNHIIDQINKASMFLEVFRSVEVVIEKNEDPFSSNEVAQASLSGDRNNSRT